MKVNSTLTYINLSDNNSGPVGGEHIAEALKVNSTLKRCEFSSESLLRIIVRDAVEPPDDAIDSLYLRWIEAASSDTQRV